MTSQNFDASLVPPTVAEQLRAIATARAWADVTEVADALLPGEGPFTVSRQLVEGWLIAAYVKGVAHGRDQAAEGMPDAAG